MLHSIQKNISVAVMYLLPYLKSCHPQGVVLARVCPPNPRHLQLCSCYVPHGNLTQNFKIRRWIQWCIRIDRRFTSDVLQWNRWIAPTLSEEYLVEKTNKFSTNGWDVMHAEREMLSSAYSSMSSYNSKWSSIISFWLQNIKIFEYPGATNAKLLLLNPLCIRHRKHGYTKYSTVCNNENGTCKSGAVPKNFPVVSGSKL